jgi:hypothetical protein
VYPFLSGHFGKYLVFVSMGLLVVFVGCTALFWSARQALGDVEKAQLPEG